MIDLCGSCLTLSGTPAQVVDRVYRTSADGATAYVERHLVERVLEIKVTNTQHDGPAPSHRSVPRPQPHRCSPARSSACWVLTGGRAPAADTRRFTWVDGGLGKLWERICTIWPSAAEFKTETVDEETFTKDEWSGKITRTVTRQYVRHMTHRLRYVDGDPVAWRWNGQPNPQDSALVAIKTNDDLMHAVPPNSPAAGLLGIVAVPAVSSLHPPQSAALYRSLS